MLAVAHLSLRFGGVTALNDVTLAFASGEVTGLVGPNGAGKTTLFNAITGLARASAGSVTFGDRDITALKPQQIARLGLARSFQHTRIAQQLTVLENVMLACPAVTDQLLSMTFLSGKRLRRLRQDAEQHLAMVGLAAIAGRRTDRLSFGEQRLVMIACLLASGAHTLLLDEPTGGIDLASRTRVLELVLALRKLGRTVVLIEHNLDVIRGTADRVVFLAQGQVMAIGAAADIEADPALASLYFGTRAYA